MSEQLFGGRQPRECGEHRPGRTRAWCYECTEWCYPRDGCKGCRIPDLERQLALAREGQP